MAVHGNRVPPQLVETSPLDPGTGADYGRAKYLAEQAVFDAAARGLRAISLRPARIYGPFSRTFTVRPLQALREGRLVLSGDADSPSNMVFVDNVVEAILKALNAPDTECGEAFLISDRDQLSWRDVLPVLRGRPQRRRSRDITLEPGVAAGCRPGAAMDGRRARDRLLTRSAQPGQEDAVDRSGGNACHDDGGNGRRRSSSVSSGRWASTRRSPIGSRSTAARAGGVSDRSDVGRLRQGRQRALAMPRWFRGTRHSG